MSFNLLPAADPGIVALPKARTRHAVPASTPVLSIRPPRHDNAGDCYTTWTPYRIPRTQAVLRRLLGCTRLVLHPGLERNWYASCRTSPVSFCVHATHLRPFQSCALSTHPGLLRHGGGRVRKAAEENWNARARRRALARVAPRRQAVLDRPWLPFISKPRYLLANLSLFEAISRFQAPAISPLPLTRLLSNFARTYLIMQWPCMSIRKADGQELSENERKDQNRTLDSLGRTQPQAVSAPLRALIGLPSRAKSI